jgi:AraC-like DNA-binding protein
MLGCEFPGLRVAYEAVEKAETLLAESRKAVRSGLYFRDTLASGYWSPEVFRLFGLREAEKPPPLETWTSMLVGSDKNRVIEAARQAYEEGREYHAEFSLHLKDGSLRVLRSHAHPSYRRFGFNFALIGTLTDVTAEIESRGLLAVALKELSRYNSKADEAASLQRLEKQPRTIDFAQNAWSLAGGGNLSPRIRRVLRLIEEQFPADVSVSEMAREAGLSDTHFSRTFQRITGESPHQFILRLKLERASATLADVAAPKIASIAAECGFYDQAHFTRHFRRRFGTTPGEMARRLASKQAQHS